MSLTIGGLSGWQWWYSNVTAPSTTAGLSVTPGSSSAEGSWTQIASAANIANDVYWVRLIVHTGSTTATSKNHLLDLGIDPAGGTSYTARVSNLQMGAAQPLLNGGKVVEFPMFIPAGSTVAVRVQGNASTAGTVLVWGTFYGRPLRPDLAPLISWSETIGTITGSRGPVVTPGTSAAEGAWTLITTTSQRWRYLLATFQMDDSTSSAQIVHVDIAYGNGSTYKIIVENAYWCLPASAEAESMVIPAGAWCDIPSGSSIYVRMSSTIGTLDSNYAVLVHGFN